MPNKGTAKLKYLLARDINTSLYCCCNVLDITCNYGIILTNLVQLTLLLVLIKSKRSHIHRTHYPFMPVLCHLSFDFLSWLILSLNYTQIQARLIQRYT